jgi:hypothetical protein
MKSEAEVRKFFATELHDALFPLEEYRKKKIRKIRTYCYIALVFVIPLVFVIIQQWGVLVGFFIFAILFSLGLAYETLGKMQDALQEKFKSGALPRLLEYLFHQFTYNPNQRIARSTLIESQLISDEITVIEGEDFMRFKLGETGIMFCETIVYRKNKSDGPIFHGVFLVASFNKHFKSQTIILPRSKVSILSKIIKYKIFDIFKVIKLEDADFNREFTVYSTDQVEARYILSPSLMSRILFYKQKVNRKISFSFVHDKMFCTIPNYINLFEPALFNSFYDFAFIQKSYEALKHYTDIVEDLNLNLRIWNY